MNVTTDNGLAENHERVIAPLATRPERARTNSPNPPTNTHSDVALYMAAARAFAARQDVRRVQMLARGLITGTIMKRCRPLHELAARHDRQADKQDSGDEKRQ